MRHIVALLIALALATVAEAQTASITLTWTAPGDDGNVGKATIYALRYSTAPPAADTLSWWNAATPATGLPAPATAGMTQTVTLAPIGGFAAGSYYFAIRAFDEMDNASPISNIALRSVAVVDATPPGRITDLRSP